MHSSMGEESLVREARNWEVEINNEDSKRSLIYSNNQGAISRAKNSIHHSRTKHIEVNYNSIRDSIENGEVKLEYLLTEDLIADCLTKALDRNKKEYFNTKMGLIQQITTMANVAQNVTELSQSRGRVRGTIFKSESQLLEELIDNHEKLIDGDIKVLDELIGYRIRREVSIERRYNRTVKRKAPAIHRNKYKRRRKHQQLAVTYLINYKRVRYWRKALSI
ncbi:hypothetical protein O181_080359 [Austropuccinia psidii MF-1]|uniref:Uncharacterized protein n=1 Tax=Austropuccinia psidii MF-1 TaxID=1389203 RepID=A0A9Q3FK89_9BASI|nr:hypothetical protein [Austropuccinia psidii MF-1]